MNENLRRQLPHVVYLTGAAIAITLTALALLRVPCPGDPNCLPVLNSRFTVIFRLPASLYGALFWLGIMCVDDRVKRGALLGIFVACSTVFLALQLYVLRGFCGYCVLHASLVLGAFLLRDFPPRKWWILGAIGLAAVATGATLRWTPAEIIPTPKSQTLATSKGVQPWLGPITESSPVLVLKVDDPRTLSLLEALTSVEWVEPARGPAIYFVVTPENKTLTTIFVADVLAHANRGSRAFLDAARELSLRKEQAIAAPGTLARTWTASQPLARERRVSAAWLLNDQEEQVRFYRLGRETPELLTADGKRSTTFDPALLFDLKPSTNANETGQPAP